MVFVGFILKMAEVVPLAIYRILWKGTMTYRHPSKKEKGKILTLERDLFGISDCPHCKRKCGIA